MTTSMRTDQGDRRLTSVAAVCEHGAESHDGTEPSIASAPEASRAWLLVEHPGPWPHEAADAALPAPLAGLVRAAVDFGGRGQMIPRPGRRQAGGGRTRFLGWAPGGEPLRPRRRGGGAGRGPGQNRPLGPPGRGPPAFRGGGP